MTIQELLLLAIPEKYDLKNENNYDGIDNLEVMLNYKKSDDGFDCDGSLGKQYCKLIREIYRILWDWNDLIDESHVRRYAEVCVNDGLLMGPETMNSFATTYKIAKNAVEREKLCLFSNSVGRIGNMTLTYAGFNKYIAYDYWDIKIQRQYLNNISLSKAAKNRYINLFFQWDYVLVENNEYILKEFWDGHSKKFMPSPEVISSYIKLIDLYTERRGLFMVGMLKVASVNRKDYEVIRKNVFTSDFVYEGYIDVLNRIKNQYLSKETKVIIEKLLEEICALERM